MTRIFVRKAQWSDVDLLFEWANESEVRKNSFNTDDVKYDNHKRWFEGCMQDKEVDIYICYIDAVPVGQIRLKYKEDTAVISYSITEKFRGQGIGTDLIKMVETELSDDRPDIKCFVGNVKPENIASQRIFEKNGYEKKYVNSEIEYYIYSKIKVT